ncbi:unnamed protein product [Prorocentrum cordatum]|uniref:Uncharacterized protein n=1 Tax=Prorocentrum cordatum TaxID=2364126 RepID=A0ABN9WLW7_9DINO|nr:unnamed protein product [Polarella glacialis]
MPEDAGPQWFRDNVSAPCESRFVTVEGCRIHYLAWRAARGDEATTTARRAGLVFLHGNAAHAHWWSFLAPFFAQSTTASPSPGRGTGGRAGATGTATTSGRGRWPPPPRTRSCSAAAAHGRSWWRTAWGRWSVPRSPGRAGERAGGAAALGRASQAA